MKKFIAVAGNIGVGKSTLVNMLGARLGWEPFFEGVTDNPYLKDFYADMRAWAFHSQIFFLARRLRDLRGLMDYPHSVVQDRSVYEDAEIFAKNLYRQGFIAVRDWKTYRELYEATIALLPPPDLIVYLRASVPTLQHRITQRGREYEKKIAPEYLTQLNTLYEEWIDDFHRAPVLIVPADRLDFVSNNQHFDLVAQKVQEKLRGEQMVLFE
ncbi:deoxyadenosine/deoxycytidine kinase [Anaerolineae bacterium]|nr:deoxyadenosine/deoxycytidine kinase [Anaerolineae bacterium]